MCFSFSHDDIVRLVLGPVFVVVVGVPVNLSLATMDWRDRDHVGDTQLDTMDYPTIALCCGSYGFLGP